MPEIIGDKTVEDGENLCVHLLEAVPVQGEQPQAAREADEAPLGEPGDGVVGEDQFCHDAGAHLLAEVGRQLLYRGRSAHIQRTDIGRMSVGSEDK